MDKFNKIRALCETHRSIGQRVIDNFILFYVAFKKGLDKKITAEEKKYKHVIRELPSSFFPTVSAQFIVGKAFMKNGMLKHLAKGPFFDGMSREELDYLNVHLQTPWRYVFVRIVGRPERDFFIVRDEILGDELLVYSPGIQKDCENGHEGSLFFLLVGFNGECWQTYGLIAAFRSFDVDDVYLYGTEVFGYVEDDQSFMNSVYENPFPYFMLILGQELPIVVGGEHVLKHHVGTCKVPSITTQNLENHFKIQWNKGIYQFTLTPWSRTPHYAAAYYVERDQLLYCYALTGAGYGALVSKLIHCGVPVAPSEEYSVSLNIVRTMESILKRKLVVNPYERNFPDPNGSKLSDTERAQVNAFLALLLPVFNSGQQPNLLELSQQSGVDLETAQEIYQNLVEKFKE